MVEPEASQDKPVLEALLPEWTTQATAWNSNSKERVELRAPEVEAYANRQDRVRKRAAR